MYKISGIAVSMFFPFAVMSQHTLVLKSGDKMNGVVREIKDNNLSFSFKGNLMTFNLDEVSVIHFSEVAFSNVGDAETKKVLTSEGTKGVTYVMHGRKVIRQPVVNNMTQEHGTVVVAITIDKYGHVVKAEPGVEGTTTTNKYLYDKAKQAAESTKFDTSPTMPLKQEGTISIVF
jgi:hypothetical protein